MVLDGFWMLLGWVICAHLDSLMGGEWVVGRESWVVRKS